MRTIASVSAYAYALPVSAGNQTGHGTVRAREGAIFILTMDNGTQGAGEMVALPEFAGDSAADLMKNFAKIKPLLCGQTLPELLDLLHGANAAAAYAPQLRFGLETAALDALGKLENCSVCNLLTDLDQTSGTKQQINCVIADAATDMAAAKAQRCAAAGYSVFKLKMGLSQNVTEEIDRIRAVSAVLPNNSALRLDPNEQWSLAAAQEILNACAQWPIEYCEQPLSRFAGAEIAKLQTTTHIPIALDEAVCSPEQAFEVIANHTAQILILKPALLGSLFTAKQIIQAANRSSIRCVVTSPYESGIGTAADLALACASPEIIHACGLAGLDLLADDLILTPLHIAAGVMYLPFGAGLGVNPDIASLERFSTQFHCAGAEAGYV